MTEPTDRPQLLELPDQLPDDPEARLALLGAILAARVVVALPTYLTASTQRVIDAWGRLDASAQADCRRLVEQNAPETTRAVAAQLQALVALPAIEQRVTPLEIVRRAVAMPTATLASFGIPEIVRDAFETEHAPDDHYGLAPHALSDLGDAQLGPIQLAWGLAKHQAIRAATR